ncbi:MAG: sensor histidine kinase [Clostridia bacterium]|nr:sensor histidine kinase [Clostridia bacterium]NCC43138.1 sensor histidine kinase [Clostridia bacterium]
MRHSIRSKLLMAILVVTVLTVSTITMAFYFKSADMIEENYSESLYGRVEQMTKLLDDSIKEIYYINLKTASDEQLYKEIKTYQGTKSNESIDAIAQILRTSQEQYKDLSSLYLILPDEGTAVTSDEYPVCKRELSLESIEEIENTASHEPLPMMTRDVVHEDGILLSGVQTINDENGEILAYLAANIQERTLYYQYLEPLYDDIISEAIVLSENNDIITSKDYGRVGESYEEMDKIPKRNGFFEQEGEDTICIFERGYFSGCGIYLTVPKNQVLGDLAQMRTFLLGVVAAVIFVAVLLAGYITRAICRPIKNMTDTVELVGQGELSLRLETAAKDEIGVLCTEFNSMLDYIENLIAQVIQEEKQKKDAELEALQYQITPHFMYNTLNSIKYSALIKGEKEIGGLLEDFVELLQASINKKGTFITVADELHILMNYVHLQQFRYQESFEVIYEVDLEASGCYIPRLILQPLVENAILHGIDMKNKKGQIKIQGKIENEDRLTLTVSDNGRGMSKEQIDELLNNKTKKTSGLSAVGIPNIRERLELYYGDKGGIGYESTPEGTTACIYLPVNRQ